MKKSKSSNAFLMGLSGIIVLSAFASWYFYNAMSNQYILISNGMEPTTQILDNYSYAKNQKNMIIALSALASSFFFLIMLIIPDDKPNIPDQQHNEHVYDEMSDIGVMSEQTGSSIAAEISPDTDLFPAAEPALEGIDEDNIEIYDDGYQEVTEGEDDVVYGIGAITAAAIVDFVHKHPDSALKFLFRKQLDGKPLTTDEDDIYLGWEQRGMSRGKVKAYMLTLMEWDTIPKEPLYELWKKIRDHIYENFN